MSQPHPKPRALRKPAAAARPEPHDPDAYEPPEFEAAYPQPRFDGWTPRFVEALAKSACVAEACGAVGISRQSAYALRAHASARARLDALTGAYRNSPHGQCEHWDHSDPAPDHLMADFDTIGQTPRDPLASAVRQYLGKFPKARRQSFRAGLRS